MTSAVAKASRSDNFFTVDGLTVGGNYWRIDWFGAVSYCDRSRSQPKIEVQLSRIPEGWDNLETLPEYDSGTWPYVRQARMPVGLLPLFKIGDIWRDGRLAHQPKQLVEEFTDVRNVHTTSSLIKAGSTEEASGNFYLPFSHHPYHLQHTNSYCVLIRHLRGLILIPTTEMIRFYFGSSSSLIARLFDAPLDQEKLWTNVSAGSYEGQQKIDLAPGISGRSASDVARIALSRSAYEAAELVSSSCIAATANGERAYPKATFPFADNTDISIAGRWLPHELNGQRIFLTHHIKSCTNAFPFSSLKYTLSSANGMSMTNSPRNAGFQKKTATSMKSKQEEATAITDEGADKKRKARELILLGETKFPDLTWKKVVAIEGEIAPTITMNSIGAATAMYAVDIEGNSKSVRPIEAVPIDEKKNFGRPQKQEHALQVFYQLTTLLTDYGRYPSVDMIRLNARQRYPGLVQMPIVRNEDGEISQESFIPISSPCGKSVPRTRPRQIFLGRILSTTNCYYYAIPEPINEADRSMLRLFFVFDRFKALRTDRDMYFAIASLFDDFADLNFPITLPFGLEAKTLLGESATDQKGATSVLATQFFNALTAEINAASIDETISFSEHQLPA